MNFLKSVLILLLFSSSLFGADMVYVELTNINIINYFASILINVAAVIAPLFGALALMRH